MSRVRRRGDLLSTVFLFSIAILLAGVRPLDSATIRLVTAPKGRAGLFRESDGIRVEPPSGQTVRVRSWRGQPVYNGSPTNLHLRCGHYFVEAGDRREQFAVLPDGYRGASFLGTEAAPTGEDPSARARAERVALIQPAWVRIMDVSKWSYVRPTRDRFNWRPLDQMVAANASRRIILAAWERPAWVTDEEFTPAFAEYVGKLAARYQGRVFGIEAWNEPMPGGNAVCLPGCSDWTQTVAVYNRLLVSAAATIRRHAKRVKVIGPAWYSTGFVGESRVLRQELLDYFSVHDYAMRVVAPDRTSDFSVDSAHKISGLHRQLPRLSAVRHRPLLVDEIGLYGHSALGIPTGGGPLNRSELDWRQGMLRTVKYVVMYRAAGAQCLLPHLLPACAESPRTNLELYGWEAEDRGPHPKTTAFLMTCHLLDGAQPVGDVRVVRNCFLSAWQFADGGAGVLAWCAESTSAKLPSGLPVRVGDIFGQELPADKLDDEPRWLRPDPPSAPAAMIETLIAALQ